MKYHFQNILKLKVLLLLVFLFTISSCDNDDDSFNPLLVSIDIPEGFLDSDGKFFLLASDKAGNVIEFAEIIDGEVTELKSDSYKESTFTLSLVDTYNSGTYKNFYGSSYHNLKRGVKIVLSEEDFESESYLEFTAQNFDSNTASEYTIASNGSDYTVYPENLTGYLYLTKSPTRLFITKYNLDYEASGYIFPTTTYATGSTPSVNLIGDYAAFQSETVNFADPVYAGVSVYGRTSASSYEEQYSVSQTYGYDEPLAVKYPGTTFPAYSSESYVEGDDYYYEAYHKSQRSDFSMLDVNATVDINGQTIEYSVTGDGSTVYFEFEQEGSDFESYDWDMTAPVGSTQSVTIPKLPSEITTGFSTYSYTAWAADEEVTVLEIETVDSIDKLFGLEMGDTEFASLNRKSMSLYMGSGAARKGRMDLTKEKKHQIGLGKFKSHFKKDRSSK